MPKGRRKGRGRVKEERYPSKERERYLREEGIRKREKKVKTNLSTGFIVGRKESRKFRVEALTWKN